ncbi:hypothetical protein PI125_g17257 [Phytophthora idaei]|nr:hypothetical protein PI125_g17257 [Phytophthora idaei]
MVLPRVLWRRLVMKPRQRRMEQTLRRLLRSQRRVRGREVLFRNLLTRSDSSGHRMRKMARLRTMPRLPHRILVSLMIVMMTMIPFDRGALGCVVVMETHLGTLGFHAHRKSIQ